MTKTEEVTLCAFLSTSTAHQESWHPFVTTRGTKCQQWCQPTEEEEVAEAEKAAREAAKKKHKVGGNGGRKSSDSVGAADCEPMTIGSRSPTRREENALRDVRTLEPKLQNSKRQG
jgi:hypothetical protein